MVAESEKILAEFFEDLAGLCLTYSGRLRKANMGLNEPAKETEKIESQEGSQLEQEILDFSDEDLGQITSDDLVKKITIHYRSKIHDLNKTGENAIDINTYYSKKKAAELLKKPVTSLNNYQLFVEGERGAPPSYP